jgi:toxin ParE1/3/4
MAHQRAPSADSDLDDIWYYVAKESGSIEQAERFIASITERFYLLSENPYIGRSRDDLRPGLRSFSVGKYVISLLDQAARPQLRPERGRGCRLSLRRLPDRYAPGVEGHREQSAAFPANVATGRPEGPGGSTGTGKTAAAGIAIAAEVAGAGKSYPARRSMPLPQRCRCR